MQTSTWKDYKYGSWLVLVFGKVSCKIVVRQDGVDLNQATQFGLIFLPDEVLLFSGTLDEAKHFAEVYLTAVLMAALQNLGAAAAHRTFGMDPVKQELPQLARVYTAADIAT